MKRCLLVLAALIGLTGADTPKTDQDTFQGTWKVFRADKAGKPMPQELRDSLTVTFRDDRLILKNGENTREATFKLNPKAKPKQITIIHRDGKTRPVEGIYLIDARGRLFICVSEPGKPRPNDFPPRNKAPCELLGLSVPEKQD